MACPNTQREQSFESAKITFFTFIVFHLINVLIALMQGTKRFGFDFQRTHCIPFVFCFLYQVCMEALKNKVCHTSKTFSKKILTRHVMYYFLKKIISNFYYLFLEIHTYVSNMMTCKSFQVVLHLTKVIQNFMVITRHFILLTISLKFC